MKWPSVIRAMFGITATAWIFPVRCLVTQMFFGNVRFVVTEIAGPVNLCRYIECHGFLGHSWYQAMVYVHD